MGKAVLVIDMPKNCFACKLQDWVNCRIVKGCHTGDTRPVWCPLREVPEKADFRKAKTETVANWIEGWNACIDRILGGSSTEEGK